MPYETDERLKSYLDTNQLYREQMCRAILALDKRFKNVTPRHPRGGPDGGKDIDAVYRDFEKAGGAVGFVNSANDSRSQKSVIRKKYKADLGALLSSVDAPKVFVFMTNLNFSLSEKEKLKQEGIEKGLHFCEIFDRESLRILLDTPDGFSIRFQFLGIPLSESEQVSFFAKWGDDIQSVIATGFQKIESTLSRVLFLQEASRPVLLLTVSLELDREYSGVEIGHFRAYANVFIPEINEVNNAVFSIIFGATDKANRTRFDGNFSKMDKSGLTNGISAGQWEMKLKDWENDQEANSDQTATYEQTCCSSGVGLDKIKNLPISYRRDSLIRQASSLNILNLDDAMFVIKVNKSLGDKINRICVYCNGYKLKEIEKEGVRLDLANEVPDIPINFDSEELEDPWVILRPSNGASIFKFSFFEKTPKRMFSCSEL